MIIGWLYVALIAVSTGILALVILLIIKKCFRRKNPRDSDPPERDRTLQSGIARLHQVSPAHNHHHHHHHHRKDNNPAFSWADHPSYVTEAVENGWSRFAFVTAFTPPSPPPSAVAARSLLGSCGGGGGDRAAGVETNNNNNNNNIEIGWEVCEGSADFMQKIRLNAPNGGSTAGPAVSAVRAGLPLPGPNLGNASFPQEAYFEVTILSSSENAYDRDELGKLEEGDRIKLIGEDFNAKNSGDSLGHVKSSHSQRSSTKIEEAVSKIAKKQGVRNEGVSLCVGLVGGGGGGHFPVRFPGSFPGSIGFNSSGSVYLDGTKLVSESETNEWGGKAENVIGCGYNPSQKKVLFTVNSQLVHEISCKRDEFASPLYPTIASSNTADITILINLGQSPFRFAPANLTRTRNPCFIGGPYSNSPALSYEEDSRELFSMGRIDSHWQQRSANRSNNNTVNSIRDIEYDQESEGDLFEIVLDSSGRSPYTTLHQ